MSWATFLFNHFIQNILPSDKKLLIDETSLCSISSFVQLLNERKVKFIVVRSTKALFKALHSDINLIIADQSNLPFSIPESICSACQTIKVDYESLPFNIDYILYKKLRLNDLLTILNFASQNPQEFITDADTAKILEQSLKNSVIKTNKEFESIFENFATQPEQMTYNDVLYVGLCWGEYVYNCFKISATPDRDILHCIDSKVLKFIVNSGLKNLPYGGNDNIAVISPNKTSLFKKSTGIIC